MRFSLVAGQLFVLAGSLIQSVSAKAWMVEAYTDEYCEHSTGIWSDSVADPCEDLTSFSVEIKSIKFTGDWDRCGFHPVAFIEGGCQAPSGMAAVDLLPGRCQKAPRKIGENYQWQSFNVIENPC